MGEATSVEAAAHMMRDVASGIRAARETGTSPAVPSDLITAAWELVAAASEPGSGRSAGRSFGDEQARLLDIVHRAAAGHDSTSQSHVAASDSNVLLDWLRSTSGTAAIHWSSWLRLRRAGMPEASRTWTERVMLVKALLDDADADACCYARSAPAGAPFWFGGLTNQTVREAVLEVIDSGEQVDSAEVLSRVQLKGFSPSAAVISNELARWSQSGELERVKRGVYRRHSPALESPAAGSSSGVGDREVREGPAQEGGDGSEPHQYRAAAMR